MHEFQRYRYRCKTRCIRYKFTWIAFVVPASYTQINYIKYIYIYIYNYILVSFLVNRTLYIYIFQSAYKNNFKTALLIVYTDIVTIQLKNLGPKAHKWLHTMLNTCFIENKIPNMWWKSKIIAILKPGKDSPIPKNYRLISLLCHTYKLYERLILNRVSPLIEQHLIKEQAGFRPGKSCTSQLLNLTQHIKDGYQRGMITGAAFVDLSAAYDTVNHRILVQKLYNTTQDSQLCRVFQNMLSNRRFYVELNNERSRWRNQKNGMPQGSVLSPILFQHSH